MGSNPTVDAGKLVEMWLSGLRHPQFLERCVSLAEAGGLENRKRVYARSGVQIPPSPPF